MKSLMYWIIVALLVVAFLPVSISAQGQQRLQYQSSHNQNALATAQDVSTEDPETDSKQRGRDHAVGITGLLFIVVVVAIGVLFAIVMVAGHGGRKAP